MRKITTKFMSAFSLMEMMIVLLIISIIAAASAPMVSKKLSRDAGTAENPWVYTDLGGNMAFNTGGRDVTAMIGARSLPGGFWAANNHPKLYIQSNGDEPQLSFGSNGGSRKADLVVDMRQYENGGARIGISNATLPAGTVALGANQSINANATQGVAIGNGVSISNNGNVVIGSSDNQRMYDLRVFGYYKSQSTGHNYVPLGMEREFVAGSDYDDAKSKINMNKIMERFKHNADLIYGNHDNIQTAWGTFDQTGTAALYGGNSVAIGKYARSINGDATAVGAYAYAHILGTSLGNYAYAGISSSAIGHYARAEGDHSIAIGDTAEARSDQSIAIGDGAVASHLDSTAIGTGALASHKDSTAIGAGATALHTDSTAIGADAVASHLDSTAIGAGAVTTASKQIVLGRSTDTVYIPGNLVVGKQAALNVTSGTTAIKIHNHSAHFAFSAQGDNGVTIHDVSGGGFCNINDFYSTYSDRRLKNVGDKFVEGIEALKKIDIYHYTFKNDPEKIEHVGVMAQDLQKVFPNAVVTGEDGYLRIRLEDMFYALVNAVKELDTRISEVVNQVKSNLDEITKLKATVAEQQKTIDDLEARLARLEKANGIKAEKAKKAEKPTKTEKVKKEK